jgi:hypothetical protein
MSLPAISVALYQGLHKMTKNPLFNGSSSKKCVKTFLDRGSTSLPLTTGNTHRNVIVPRLTVSTTARRLTTTARRLVFQHQLLHW